MIRKFKALGLALVAVFAMSALSAASATAVEFHSQATHTILSGEQHAGEDTFSVNAGTVRCNKATYAGTQNAATATTQTVTPTYEECKAFGFVNTKIDTNGCSYTFDSNANNVDITCPGNPITVTAFNCYVTVGSQENLGSVTYTNNVKDVTKEGVTSSTDVTVDVNITGIKYTQHSQSFPGCTNGTFTTGTYTGAATVKGADTAGNQVGIWVH